MDDQNSAYIFPPKEPTVEEAKRFVSTRVIEIVASSTITGYERNKDGKVIVKRELKKVIVKNESEMKPELVMRGPTKRGSVNSYIGIDGHKHIFDAETGEAIGSDMRSIENPKRPKLDALTHKGQ